ncbi:MarR family transcriptional regulator [Pseudonocardia yuanmonensis]|uniref:MarR family transcriptional regulator n=1 Tax=Pseudonocardia yuanmonensis TaxID=1095914 RepID=A0ABP8WGL3_9PSEU
MAADRDAVDEIRAIWAVRRPDLDTGPIAVVGRILRAARFLQQAADDWLADAGVTRAEFDLLSQLRRTDAPLRPGDLTAGVVGSPAATTKRLHKLTAAGLVTRTPDPDDARAARVALTPAGEQLVDDLLPRQIAAEARLLEVLTPAQRESLAGLLRTALIAWEP